MPLLRLSRSIVGEEEALAVKRLLLEDGYLGMGREVQSLERDLAEYLSAPPESVICVSSGTAALHLAVEAVTEPGEEILVQSLTFLGSFQAITAGRATPVACEVDPRSVTIDLADAERRLTKGTRAIMPVHYASFPAGLDAIYGFAGKHGLRVIEDAAHAFGCRHAGKKIGSRGDVVCFSFDGIKNITCGEGGAVITRDPVVADRIRDARLLGVQKDTEKRYAGARNWEFDVTRIGYRYHMSNVCAAIGRVQLRRLDAEFAPKRVALARRYRERLEGCPGIALFATELRDVVPHIQPIRVLAGRRDGLRATLEGQGVETGIHYKPNHLLTLYARPGVRLPVTEQLYGELLSLPLHPGMELRDVDRVCDLVRDTMSDKNQRGAR